MVANAIKSSTIINPLEFFCSPTYGGKVSDPIVLGVIAQIRPIAAMYLSFPAGSGDVERGFSQTGLVMTDHRNRLHEESLEHIFILGDYCSQPYYNFPALVKVIASLLENETNENKL